MGLTWGPDREHRPTVPELENGLAAQLMDALDPRCRRTDLYESRSVARGAIRRLRRERGLWPYAFWRPWQCRRIGCDWWHAGPKGSRAR